MFVYLARNSTNQKPPSTNIGVYQPKEDELPSNSSGSNEGKKDESLMDSLRRKVKSLDPPPWPQLDSRTANAIANKGILVGPQETSNDATIVSAYYNFESKHDTSSYRQWFQRLLRASDPLVIFVEPDSEWVDFVRERRTHAPTLIVPQKFDDLVMSTTFTESFWQEQHAIDLEAKIHKGTGVYKIWNEKLVLLHATMELNPFDSSTFMWMDAGYFRNERISRKNGELIVNRNINSAGVPPSKVMLIHVRNDPLSTRGINKVATAGNAFIGTKEAMYELYEKYYETLWSWVIEKKFLGSDQFVMTETCYRYPQVCNPTFPGRFKDWFAMSKLLRNEEFPLTNISDQFHFKSESEVIPLPPKQPPKVPIKTMDIKTEG
eukprot:CAMPEP_0116066424 /NCGR_PEP_ID=MMETSP0322-20121206/10366_1 /TAXON_ID=163516 /ORGANISM="Leptocylindrus danicus var. apora, Strain B651" /LENGTH=376 /DNA_ID=CAMNT_0003552959 /DNA_START=139 /DNA_END=1269 /DNA_ORIENTATION=-